MISPFVDSSDKVPFIRVSIIFLQIYSIRNYPAENGHSTDSKSSKINPGLRKKNTYLSPLIKNVPKSHSICDFKLRKQRINFH